MIFVKHMKLSMHFGNCIISELKNSKLEFEVMQWKILVAFHYRKEKVL